MNIYIKIEDLKFIIKENYNNYYFFKFEIKNMNFVIFI